MSTLRVNASQTAGGVDSYRYVDTVYFTSNGTFVKADYPWLRAIRVKVQGGGGGGAGAAATTSSQISGGPSSGGGGYAEKFFSDISAISATETITVGLGGAGGVATAASSGGQSTAFGLTANGGNVGSFLSPRGAPDSRPGGPGGNASGGDLNIKGGSGGAIIALTANMVFAEAGGESFLSNSSRASSVFTPDGYEGNNYGGGASSAVNHQNDSNNRTGKDGADGIVIVELYA